MRTRILIAALAMLAASAQAWTWSQIDTVILRECHATGVPFAVAERLIQSESSWDPRAVNPSDPSVGIAQLQIRLLPWFAEQFNGGRAIDPWDSFVSARILVRYLAWLHDRTAEGASWYYAALSYKAGLARVTGSPVWGADIELRVRAIAWWVATGGTEQ